MKIVSFLDRIISRYQIMTTKSRHTSWKFNLPTFHQPISLWLVTAFANKNQCIRSSKFWIINFREIPPIQLMETRKDTNFETLMDFKLPRKWTNLERSLSRATVEIEPNRALDAIKKHRFEFSDILRPPLSRSLRPVSAFRGQESSLVVKLERVQVVKSRIGGCYSFRLFVGCPLMSRRDLKLIEKIG